ncbi:bifunctional 5,10-methylenetetrahydrofolate dehydrogenase/5,10-methenyltetrahydrofolate cyclohydrolase [Patescibacteria group bacterium]|nr:bifunctional 5,10-methylenetetrahydrofolate dehydrogenase/5,10-methenyltetrahydrofolate cyclohydrolase [Patescibacteria group bacterium]MCL5091791.1 bifunctional 5,10-methylenetetrahydrofolate dehydrogenase/5,10-methenyltetrahydrofolate cyclohydrolase [Patescibacteria group bacterium]
MQLPGKEIAQFFEDQLAKEVARLKHRRHPVKLLVFLIGQSAEQLSFVKMKQRVAQRLGILFTTHHFPTAPIFEAFVRTVKEKSQSPDVTGVVIQQPLPNTLQTNSLYDFIPLEKEIEGQRRKTPFLPPIGMAVLTCLKYVYGQNKINRHLLVDAVEDRGFFKKTLRHKKVVLVGRGITGGRPIGKALNEMRINFFNINSQTPNPEYYYENADLVITATGKNVINPALLRPGVVLLNVGLRREKGKLVGDYDEKAIKEVASVYSTTPGGIGPIDVLYLYKNLIDAAKLQCSRKTK